MLYFSLVLLVISIINYKSKYFLLVLYTYDTNNNIKELNNRQS